MGQTFDLGSWAKFWVVRNLGRDSSDVDKVDGKKPMCGLCQGVVKVMCFMARVSFSYRLYLILIYSCDDCGGPTSFLLNALVCNEDKVWLVHGAEIWHVY